MFQVGNVLRYLAEANTSLWKNKVHFKHRTQIFSTDKVQEHELIKTHTQQKINIRRDKPLSESQQKQLSTESDNQRYRPLNKCVNMFKIKRKRKYTKETRDYEN